MFKRSELDRLMEPENFQWATGIEDTFITAPWPQTGRTLDEYELTQHYEKWEHDLELAKSLGIKSMRYGIPWYRINPSPNRWVWDWADRPLDKLLRLGINPVVDLVHYGLPVWLDNAYLNPDFPDRMAEYAYQVAMRFKGRIHWYTPLNEPRITSWYCGRLGWWPPCLRGTSGFISVMLAVCKGIVKTHRAIQSVDPENILVHVDATDLYESGDPILQYDVQHKQQVVFLALDLVMGKVDRDHPLHNWLLQYKVDEEQLEWFLANHVTPDIVGINMYPMFTRKKLKRNVSRTPKGKHIHLRTKSVYAAHSLVERLGELYWEHYKLPLMITETASRGRRRSAWLKTSVDEVINLRKRGIPVIGYTWWPMFSLVAWAYRQSNRPPDKYLDHMGLWDLKSINGSLERIPTPLVKQYRQLTSSELTIKATD